MLVFCQALEMISSGASAGAPFCNPGDGSFAAADRSRKDKNKGLMDASMQDPLIEMSNLTVRYGTFTALNSVSATVPGGAVGLLGPNGAGKSTLIKALLGLLRLHKGWGRLLSMDVSCFGLEIQG
jgi:ABC-type bacteriocin/lantibiotic exporter with double-glycine peptidase domain